MNVTQTSIGRFHHFHLARQLERHGLLNAVYTGYPRFKLVDEKGIPPEKIKSFPWVQGPAMMMRSKLKLSNWPWLDDEFAWLAAKTLDHYVASQIRSKTVFVGLSGAGLNTGKKAKDLGGRYICDRGSSHIRYQNEVLHEEYAIWKIPYRGISSRTIEQEEREYEEADRITVPSEFVRKSFIYKGVKPEKLEKVVYGARLERFSPQGLPEPGRFVVLWVGGVSVRKGFPYLIEAFQKFRHPNKHLKVVGPITTEMEKLIAGKTENVSFLGSVANDKLAALYSTASVFVLPSLEEGLAMVQGEALACGCPIISSTNSGAEDLITSEKEGWIIPIRSVDAIVDCFQKLVDEPHLREKMSHLALARVKELGGWDTYGDNYSKLVKSIW